MFVDDTVAGLDALAEHDGVSGGTYNIATGQDVSVAEIVRVVGELLGRELIVHTEAERLRPDNSEVHQLLGDATKLRAVTGWAPATSLRRRPPARDRLDAHDRASRPAGSYAV